MEDLQLHINSSALSIALFPLTKVRESPECVVTGNVYFGIRYRQYIQVVFSDSKLRSIKSGGKC